MREIPIVEAERLEWRLLPAAPIALASLAKSLGAGKAALTARAEGSGLLVGALELGPREAGGWMRRHSGGPSIEVEQGLYYLALVDSRGMEALYKEATGILEALYGERLRGGRTSWGVLAFGATGGYGYMEVYSSRDPSGFLEALAPGGAEWVDPSVLDLEAPASRLSSMDWLDPPPGDPEVYYEYETREGYRLALAGALEGEVIAWTRPDHTIYAYPPGQARGVFMEVSHVPPADPVAVHVMNALSATTVYLGATALEVLEAVRGYIREAQRLLQDKTPGGQTG